VSHLHAYAPFGKRPGDSIYRVAFKCKFYKRPPGDRWQAMHWITGFMQYICLSPFTTNVCSAPSISRVGSGGGFGLSKQSHAAASHCVVCYDCCYGGGWVKEWDRRTLLTQYCGLWSLLLQRRCSHGGVWSVDFNHWLWNMTTFRQCCNWSAVNRRLIHNPNVGVYDFTCSIMFSF